MEKKNCRKLYHLSHCLRKEQKILIIAVFNFLKWKNYFFKKGKQILVFYYTHIVSWRSFSTLAELQFVTFLDYFNYLDSNIFHSRPSSKCFLAYISFLQIFWQYNNIYPVSDMWYLKGGSLECWVPKFDFSPSMQKKGFQNFFWKKKRSSKFLLHVCKF